MLVCDLCLLNFVIVVVSGLSEVLGALGRILLSYLVHMHSHLRSVRQGQVHVGLITWEVLPQLGIGARLSIIRSHTYFQNKVLVSKNLFSTLNHNRGILHTCVLLFLRPFSLEWIDTQGKVRCESMTEQTSV
jgi:hypothetical protein